MKKLCWALIGALAVIIISLFPSGSSAAISYEEGDYCGSFTDFLIKGKNEVKIERFYTSGHMRKGIFGWRWKTAFDSSLSFGEKGAISYKPCGGCEEVFFKEVPGKKAGIRIISHKPYRMRHENGEYVLKTVGSYAYVFGPDGRLRRELDGQGNSIDIFYDKIGRLRQILTSGGHYLSFSYNSAGLVDTVKDDRDREATYQYDDDETLATVKTYNGEDYYYAYDEDHNLTGVIYPDGKFEAMEYGTEENGHRLLEYAHGYESYSVLSYESGQTKEGHDFLKVAETTFSFGIKLGDAVRVFTYRKDRDGRRYLANKLKKDGMGDEATFYDRWGNPVRTRSGGSTTTARFNRMGLPLRLRSSDGKKIIVRYDKVLMHPTFITQKETSPRGRVSKIVMRYNNRGRMIKAFGRGLFDLAFRYEDAGLINTLKIDGKELTFTYDEDGQVKTLAISGEGLSAFCAMPMAI